MTPDRREHDNHLDFIDDQVWDLIVIGAGPAGGMTAYLAAKAGLRTLLIERSSFPRYKVCGGCLNAAGIELLDQVGLGDIPRKCGTPIHQFCLGLNHRRLQLSLPSGVAIPRSNLDSEIVRAAQAEGACFLPETIASPGQLQSDHREVKLSSQGSSRNVQAKSVVITSGLKGISGREHETGTPFRTQVARRSRIGIGCELTGQNPDYPKGQISMAISRSGYVGLTATKDALLIASACDPQLLKDHDGPAQAAIAILREAKFPIPNGILDVHWSGTLPITRKTRPVAANRIFLAGDAAGYVEPFTGQGMAIAFQSAAKLVSVLKNAKKADLIQIEREWSNIYQREIANRHWPAQLISQLSRNPIVTSLAFGLVSCVPGASKGLIKAINRTIEIPYMP